jgi:hypothetical protein
MTKWATRMDPDWTQQYGVNEIHTVCFAPPSWPGNGGPCVFLGIPECELSFCFPDPDKQITAVMNRPIKNRNVKYWMRFACERANASAAFLMLNCDTAEQADTCVKQVEKLLPHYQRIALERMCAGDTRVREGLS